MSAVTKTYQEGYTEGWDACKKANETHSASLILGAPTTTGTYFAVIRSCVDDEDEMCVLHYRAHKGIYRAVGHAFSSRDVKPEDVIGYIGEVRERGAKGKDMFTFIQWCFNEHPGMITKEHDEWYLSDSTFPELYELFKQQKPHP